MKPFKVQVYIYLVIFFKRHVYGTSTFITFFLNKESNFLMKRSKSHEGSIPKFLRYHTFYSLGQYMKHMECKNNEPKLRTQLSMNPEDLIQKSLNLIIPSKSNKNHHRNPHHISIEGTKKKKTSGKNITQPKFNGPKYLKILSSKIP